MKINRASTQFKKGDRVRVTGASLKRMPPDAGDIGEIERIYSAPARATVRFKSKSLGPYVRFIPFSDLSPTRRLTR